MLKCIIIDDDLVSIKSLELFLKNNSSFEHVGSYTSPKAAVDFIAKNKIDVVFLDMEMPEMHGKEVVKILEDNLPHIVITSSHYGYAIDGYLFHASAFLKKPIDKKSFEQVCLKLIEVHEKSQEFLFNSDSVFVKKDSTIVRISLDDILYVEALGDYALLYTNNEKYFVHTTMSNMINRLPQKSFIRVHRSYIVRINKIDEIEDNSISINKKLIPIGKSYKKEVFLKLNIL